MVGLFVIFFRGEKLVEKFLSKCNCRVVKSWYNFYLLGIDAVLYMQKLKYLNPPPGA